MINLWSFCLKMQKFIGIAFYAILEGKTYLA